MVVNKLLIKIVLLCLIIFPASLLTVYAQGPDDEEETIIVAPSGQLNLTLKQLGYETQLLNQNRSERSYSIELPGNFQITPTGNYLDLVSSHVPAIPEKDSVLRVDLNGRVAVTFALTATNALSNTVRVGLDEEHLRTGRNSIGIALKTGDTCRDPGRFLDVLVDASSTLSFGYQQIPYPTDLALYPFPFTEKGLLNIPVTIVLPDRPTSDDLSAAATVAAGLGQTSGGDINLTTVPAGDLTPDIQNNHHLIVVGQPEANDLFNDLILPLPVDGRTLKPGQGILQEIVSPWNEFRLLLVVSGLDGEGVLKASNALNRQAHFLGMRGPVAVVVELGPLPKLGSPRTSSFTLTALDYEDQIAYGTRPQDFRFNFALPLGWQLEAPPFFVLKFAHADIISPESTLDVKLNKIPIGSTLLDNSNAGEGELIVSLPGRLLTAGFNRLEVGVKMELPDPVLCDSLDGERAWTVINGESEIFLPYNTIDLPPDLSLFPYPFSQVSGFDQTTFVLPDQPSPQTISELMQLAVRLGSVSQTEHVLTQVSYASEIDQDIRQNHHLILLGRPTKNSLLAEINASLPQPFVPGSDILEPLAVDNVAFLPDPDRDAGLLQLIGSPWNEKYSIMVVTGTTDEGVELAGQTLLEQTRRLKGNLTVVEPIFNLFSDDPPQVSSYSVDTRPATPVDQESSAIDNFASEKDLSALANRWWR